MTFEIVGFTAQITTKPCKNLGDCSLIVLGTYVSSTVYVHLCVYLRMFYSSVASKTTKKTQHPFQHTAQFTFKTNK